MMGTCLVLLQDTFYAIIDGFGSKFSCVALKEVLVIRFFCIFVDFVDREVPLIIFIELILRQDRLSTKSLVRATVILCKCLREINCLCFFLCTPFFIYLYTYTPRVINHSTGILFIQYYLCFFFFLKCDPRNFAAVFRWYKQTRIELTINEDCIKQDDPLQSFFLLYRLNKGSNHTHK